MEKNSIEKILSYPMHSPKILSSLCFFQVPHFGKANENLLKVQEVMDYMGAASNKSQLRDGVNILANYYYDTLSTEAERIAFIRLFCTQVKTQMGINILKQFVEQMWNPDSPLRKELVKHL